MIARHPVSRATNAPALIGPAAPVWYPPLRAQLVAWGVHCIALARADAAIARGAGIAAVSAIVAPGALRTDLRTSVSAFACGGAA